MSGLVYDNLSEDLRFQYSFVNRYLDAVEQKVSRAKLFNDGKYKRYKELYIGSVVAQAFSEILKDYFFVLSPDKDPPDFSLRHWIKEAPDKTVEGIIDFELVDYTEYSKTIDEVIDDKLSSKDYPEDYGLVVFFRHASETTIDFDKLSHKYQDNPRWVLFVARTTESKSGIKLATEKWIVASFNKPQFQRLVERDLKDNPNLSQVWRQKGRGRDIELEEVDFKLRLPG